MEELLAEPVPEEPAILPRKLRKAPDFALKDIEGKVISLDNLRSQFLHELGEPVPSLSQRNRPLVVNFFTAKSSSWADAVLADLHRSYEARGLHVVGICLQGGADAIEAARRNFEADYPMLVGDRNTQKAWIGSSKGWATYFVSDDGRVVKEVTSSIVNGIEGPVFHAWAEALLEDTEKTKKPRASMPRATDERGPLNPPIHEVIR